MHIYLITQSERNGYDTYDSAIVIAKDARAAKKIHPNGKDTLPLAKDNYMQDWTSITKEVTAKKVGTTTTKTPQVLLASFNAG